MSAVAIRPMERADLEPVIAMVGALARAGTRADPRFRLDPGWEADLRGLVLDQWFGRVHPFPPAWLAVAEGGPVGLVQGDILGRPAVVQRPPTVRIGNLWVDPGYRRQGIGRRLVRTYVDAARKAGFPWVEVGTLDRDPRALAFWRAMGFTGWRVILLHQDDPA